MNRQLPPPYSNQQYARHAEQDRDQPDLRDRLIDLLMRREQAPAPPAQHRAQMEERRTCKAIHNWPLRYKGENNTSSLNSFLQQVEIFAESEMISEQLLLKNIKHLLQDDAMAWYVHAYTDGGLTSWEAFKRQIREEFLPASYAFSIRIEAYHRMQGESESFSKFHQDIKALFKQVQPPMTEDEKLFVIKKNMNATYAPVAAAQQARTIEELVRACKEFDELKRMQEGTRKVSLPRSALLEPGLATPLSSQRTPRQFAPSQRFGRVNAVESDSPTQAEEEAQGDATAEQQQKSEDDYLDQQIQQLTQQLCALRTSYSRRDGRPSQFSSNQPARQAGAVQPVAAPRNDSAVATRQAQQNLICWNCDETGHRFMDCTKPQAVFFCYNCGKKGVSLRNCPECKTKTGNTQAGNQ